MDVESAEVILIDLVNEGILSMIYAVECDNDEYAHQFLYNSLEDYVRAPEKCPECGALLNFSNVKVGFKRVFNGHNGFQ